MNFYKKFGSTENFSYLICLILGSLTAFGLVISGMKGAKWFAATLLGLIIFYSLFVTARNFTRLFMWLAVFALSFRLNVHLIYKETQYSQIKGFGIGLFDIALVALVFYWILQLMLRREKFQFFPAISIPFLLYMLLAGISIFKAQDKVLSVSMFLLIVKGYIVFLYFANNVKTKSDLNWIASALAAAILMQVCVGSLQHLTGGTLGLKIIGESERAFRQTIMETGLISRVGGTIGDANMLAMYLNFFLPVLFCYIFNDVAFRYRVICAIVFVLGGLVEILTFSRGGWIALSFSIVVAIYGLFKVKFRSRFKSYTMTAIVIMFAAVTVLGTVTSVRERLFKDDYGAAHARIPMMQVAFNIIKQHPITGVGLNNYATVMNRYDRTRESMTLRFPHPVHNAFLIIGAESGLIALLCFVLVLFSVLSKSARFFQLKDRFLSLSGIGYTCGLIAYIIHAQFRMDFAGRNHFLWFACAMIVAINQLLVRDGAENVKFPRL